MPADHLIATAKITEGWRSLLGINEFARQVKDASIELAAMSAEQKNRALNQIAISLIERQEEIIKANRDDLTRSEREKLAEPLLKRLKFDEAKITDVVDGINSLIDLEEPVGKTLLATELDKGLELYKTTCPIGVIGVSFESRPDALVQIARAVAELAGQHHDLREDHLGDRARVGERRVEHRDAVRVRRLEVDLVGADAEAPEREQAARGLERRALHLGLAADAEHVHVGDVRRELLALERVLERLDLEPLGLEELDGALVDSLEQQHLDLVLGERSRAHGPRELARAPSALNPRASVPWRGR